METRILQFNAQAKEPEKVAKMLGILSRSWVIPVIRLLDSDGECSFNSIRRVLGRVTAKTLSGVLRDLGKIGVVNRNVIPSRPPRVMYSLSSKGTELVPLLVEFQSWDDRWQNVVISGSELSINAK